MMCVRLPGRAVRRVSLRGRLRLPRGALTSGLLVLSRDGRSCERRLNVPLKLILAAAVAVGGAVCVAWDVTRLGAKPLASWWFALPVAWAYARALQDADARLSHSQVLLPTLLISSEVRTRGDKRCCRGTQPLPRVSSAHTYTHSMCTTRKHH